MPFKLMLMLLLMCDAFFNLLDVFLVLFVGFGCCVFWFLDKFSLATGSVEGGVVIPKK